MENLIEMLEIVVFDFKLYMFTNIQSRGYNLKN
jgi:hypothetical protein